MQKQYNGALGPYLREHREAKGLSASRLAALAGLQKTTITRIEAGTFATPQPDTLRAIAEVLDLPLADVFALVGYAVPKELPSFKPYMRAKYKELPNEAVEELDHFFARLAKKHGMVGPVDGEDERE